MPASSSRPTFLGLVAVAALVATVAAISLGVYGLTVGGGGAVIVGAFLAHRRVGGALGWLLLGFGASALAAELSVGLLAASTAPSSMRPVAVAASTVFPLVAMFANAILLTFPSGRPRPGWRWVLWALVGLGTASCLAGLLWALQQPTGVLVAAATTSGRSALPANPAEVLAPGMYFALPLSLASLLHRHRRGSTIERLQIRWLLFAFAVLFAVTVVQNLAGDFTSGVSVAATAIAFLLIPGGVVVAVVRYRLYEIDRIISRTVTYALVAGVLALIYAVPVVALPSLFGGGSDLIVAGATLAAAAAFNPVRRRVQHLVDRRFNRTRFDAQTAVDGFGTKLADTPDLDSALGQLADLVQRSLQPSMTSIWIPRRP